MNQALADELTSINAIYLPSTLTIDTSSPETNPICILQLQTIDVSLRLQFPAHYPDALPQVLGPESVGSNVRKGVAGEVVAFAQHALQGLVPGEPCVFELLELLSENFQDLREEEIEDEHDASTENSHPHDALPPDVDPQWILSDVIIEKKSIFLARAARVSSPAEAKSFLQHLLATDKKAAKATHNIVAWRIKQAAVAAGKPEITFQDCDDDGEDAAGGRLLHLLQNMDVWGVMVVVSRWYGGIHLGADRFRIINSVAREALVKGGLDR